MKLIITSKNFNASDHLKETIDKKFQKLDKYFPKEEVANIMLYTEANKYKVEATIQAKGVFFRAEDRCSDPYEGVDKVVDKLSRQMSKFKDKLKSKFRDKKEFVFDEIPEVEPQKNIKIVKNKSFVLSAMTAEDAVIQMELLQHEFYLFLNIETDEVNVVYKRDAGDYGLLEAKQ